MNCLKLSFVLPCYNVERYIGECLESLYQQNIPVDEYEVICVNDCSTDSTEQIIKEYQHKYPTIRLINHIINKTAGGARNTGLENVKGKYVWFVDPDDMIEPNVIIQLMNYCKSGDLDVLMFNHRVIHKSLNEMIISPTYIDSEILTGVDYVNTYFKDKLSLISIVWLEIYKVEFLKNNIIIFPEIIIGEDTLFVWRSLLMASRVQSVDGIYYVYRKNDYSIAGTFALAPSADKIFSRSFQFSWEVLMLKDKLGIIDEGIATDLFKNAYWNVNHFFPQLIKSKEREKRQFYLLCKRHKSLLYKLSPYMKTSTKIIMHMANFGYVVWHTVLQLLGLNIKN